jgi:hypothetical protein
MMTFPGSPDPDLDRFVDSLVWDEWEPRVDPRGEPATMPFPIQIQDPGIVTQGGAVAETRRHSLPDAELRRLIEIWPRLGPATRRVISQLARLAFD